MLLLVRVRLVITVMWLLMSVRFVILAVLPVLEHLITVPGVSIHCFCSIISVTLSVRLLIMAMLAPVFSVMLYVRLVTVYKLISVYHVRLWPLIKHFI